MIAQKTRIRFDRIQKLRAQGLKYDRIGERLGISVEAARWTAWKGRHVLAMDERRDEGNDRGGDGIVDSGCASDDPAPGGCLTR